MGRIVPGSFAHVIRLFMASPAFTSKAESTRRNWGNALRLAEEEGGLGGCSVQVVRPAIVQGFLDALADYPGKQQVARTALKAVEKFAVVRDLVPIPFMTGTSTVGSDGGHEPWPEALVTLAETNARADLAKAIILAVNTGQRGSDTVRMSPTDLEEKLCPTTGIWRRGINVTQQKTGRRLWVPFIYPEFEAILASWDRRPGPFYLRPDGVPYSRPALSTAWNRERDNNEALKPLKELGLVLHGLRASAVVRARKRGLSDLQISNVFGMSEPMVARYSRLADQGDMAMAAVHFLNRTGGEQVTGNIQKITK
jgi:integrase